MQKAGGLALFLTDTERSFMNITTLRLLAADWLSTELDRHYIRRAHEFGSNQYELGTEQEVYGELRDYWKQCYKVRDYQTTEGIAEGVKQKHTVQLDDSQQLVLQRLLAQAGAELYQRLADDEFPSILDSLNTASPQAIIHEQEPEDEGELVSVLFEKYAELKASTGGWGSKRTINANRHAFTVFLEIAEDRPVKQLTKQVARDAAAQFPVYPKSRSKGENAKQTLKQLRKAETPTVDPETARGFYVKTNSFFKWLHDQGYMDTNPFDGLNPVKGKKKKPRRKQWDRTDIPQLFNSKEYLEGDYGSTKQSSRAAYYWVPLIGLYTGARLEEICQMMVGDIKQEDGIHFFDIQAEVDDDESSIKNASSMRRIPIHSHLIELGFLAYLETRDRGGRVFDLSYRGHRWSHTTSIWFGDYKERQGFAKNNTKVFHSFRGTLIRELTLVDIEDSRIMALVGHEQQSETRRTYDRVLPIAQLNKAIQQVDWRNELALIKPWSEMAGII